MIMILTETAAHRSYRIIMTEKYPNTDKPDFVYFGDGTKLVVCPFAYHIYFFYGHNVASFSLFYCYFYGRYLDVLYSLVPPIQAFQIRTRFAIYSFLIFPTPNWSFILTIDFIWIVNFFNLKS